MATARKKTTTEAPETVEQEVSRPVNDIDTKFEYTFGDHTLAIPFVEHIPMGVLEDAVGNWSVGQAIDRIVAKLAADQDDARRALPLSVYKDFLEQWDNASAVKLGELFG